MEIIELWPFSQGEMSGGPDRFVDAAFHHGPRVDHSSDWRRKDYLERVVIGGFPEAVRRTLGERFVAGYVLYTGQQTLPFGDKIRAVPLDALWRLEP